MVLDTRNNQVFSSPVAPTADEQQQMQRRRMYLASATGKPISPVVGPYGASLPMDPQQFQRESGNLGDPRKQIGFNFNGGPEGRVAEVTGRLLSGSRFDDASAVDYLHQQARQGSPMGQLWSNAAGSSRENQILGAGAQQLENFKTGADRLASGQMGGAAYAPVVQATDRVGDAGSSNFRAGGASADSITGTANAMGYDLTRLRGAADGTVPSAAAIQQRQGIGDAIAAQQALAATARGGNVASAMRSAAGAGQAMQSRGIADAAALRANEMATARGQLTNAAAAQGALYQAAGGLRSGLGDSQVVRAGQEVAGRSLVAQGTLGAQVTGMNGQMQGYGAEQDRTGNVLGQDRQDQLDMTNYLLQAGNIGLGNAAQVYGADRNYQTNRRAQDLQLAGSLAKGGSDMLAAFSTRPQ